MKYLRDLTKSFSRTHFRWTETKDTSRLQYDKVTKLAFYLLIIVWVLLFFYKNIIWLWRLQKLKRRNGEPNYLKTLIIIEMLVISCYANEFLHGINCRCKAFTTQNNRNYFRNNAKEWNCRKLCLFVKFVQKHLFMNVFLN